MKTIANISNWYIALLCLEAVLHYFINTPINSLVFWTVIFSSIYFAIKVNLELFDTVFFKYLNYLILLFVIYGIVYYLFGPVYIEPASGFPLNKLSYTTMILKSLLPVYTFYYLSYKQILTSDMVAKWIPIFIVVGIIVFSEEMQSATLRHRMSNDVTNNAGYYIMTLFPLFLFWQKSPIMKYTGMMVIILLVISSMKRGAILTMTLMLIYYFYETMKSKDNNNNLSIIIPPLILILGIYFYLTEYMMDNSYFMSRINDTMEGNSSSRDDLYSKFWLHILNTDFLSQLFGGGANYTLHVSYNYAHNDWLEIGVNQGLIGVLCFAAYWKGLYKKFADNVLDTTFNAMFGMVIICIFAKTFFSMSYSNTTFFSNLCLGYCLAKNDLNTNI
ncbi:MAG: O-antigen ligase family protein [Bacteroidales bacterium]|nr:O-antigen ligase family protein [Candidatus Physcocola equi]